MPRPSPESAPADLEAVEWSVYLVDVWAKAQKAAEEQ